MILLASSVEDRPLGGIPVVNHLILDAARASGRTMAVASLHDAPSSRWALSLEGAVLAEGARIRFVRGALGLRDGDAPSILATHVGLAPIGRMIAYRRGGSLRVFLHGVECWRPLPQRTLWGLRGATSVIANSAWTLRRFREGNPSLAQLPGAVCPLPARMLGDGVDSIEVSPRTEDEVRLLVVGRLWGRGLEKGQDLLLRLFSELRRGVPGLTLWIVGQGEGRADLEALAREGGVEAAIRFTGAVSDAELDGVYRSADVFVMPSRGEGFGLVFAEAMARGLPCIASRHDAGSEVVVDEETGLLVDPDDVQGVRDAILRLATDATLRDRLGRRGRERAEALYSVDAFRRRLLGLVDGSIAADA